LFVLRAVLGRLPYIVIPAAAVVVWIFYHLPDQGQNVRQLEDAVQLLGDDDKHPFGAGDGKPGFGAKGYVLIVHGLWGSGILTEADKENQRNWMKPCADAIEKQLAEKGAPEICLIDWSRAARPSDFYNRVFGERSFLADVPAIRAQAYRVGDIVATKLTGVILSKNLPRNVPIHLIGHSAGGFIVTRVARRLNDLGLIDKSQVHVTILDTPAPDSEITELVPALYPKNAIDFYVSSDLGARLETFRSAPFSPRVHKYEVPSENKAEQRKSGPLLGIVDSIRALVARVGNWGVAHRYSYTWYMKTIEHPEDYPDEGFNRSPFMRESAAASDR
jgi:pimeloyl-ACP methyl ester carboxylesterase